MFDNAYTGQYRNMQPFGDNFQYNNSPFGNRMAQGGLGQIMMMLMGRQLHPLPQPGTNQTVYDAFWRRGRDMEMLQLRNDAIANMMIAQKMGGINQNSMLFQAGAGFINNPDGPFARMMSPIIGGNPIQASMGAFANLRGMNMSAFGTTRDISTQQVKDLIGHSLYQNFYKNKEVGQADIDRSRKDLLHFASKRGVQWNEEQIGHLFGTTGDVNKGSKEYGAFQSLNATVNKLDEAFKRADLSTKAGKAAAQDLGKEIVKGIEDPNTQRQLGEAFSKAIEKGDYNTLKKATAPISDVADRLKLYSSLTGDRGKMVPTSIDFAKTWGFNLEDLTSGFYTAASNRMVGGRRGVVGSGEDFFKNAPRAMAAARGLFGNNLSGAETVNAMSEFAGVSDVNLTNPSHVSKIGDLMRDIKAIARNANISVEAMIETVNKGKMIAANTPGLQHLGGMELGRMAVGATTNAMVMASMMTNGSLRRMGGTQGLMQNQYEGQLEKMSSPITQQLGAMYMYFRGNARMQKQILDYGQNGYVTQQGLNEFVAKVANTPGALKPGQSRYDLYGYITSNEWAQREGVRLAPGLADTANRATMQQLRQAAYMNVGGGAAGQAALNAMDEGMQSTSVDYDKYLNSAAYLFDPNRKNRRQGLLLQEQFGSEGSKFKTVEDVLNMTEDEKQAQPELYKAASELNDNLTSRASKHYDVYGKQIGHQDKFLLDNGFIGNEKNISIEAWAADPRWNLGGAMNNLTTDAINNGSVRAAMMHDPRFKAEQAEVEARTASEAAFADKLDQSLGYLNQPIATSMVNQLMNGKVNEQGLAAFLEPLGLGSKTQDMVDEGMAISNMRGSTTFDDLSQALKQNFGTTDLDAEKLEDLEKLSKQYKLTPDQIKDLQNLKAADKNKAGGIINRGRADKDVVRQDLVDRMYGGVQELSKLGLNDDLKGDVSFETVRNAKTRAEVEKYTQAMARPQLDEAQEEFYKTLDLYSAGKGGATEEQKKWAKVLTQEGWKRGNAGIDDLKTILSSKTPNNSQGIKALETAMGIDPTKKDAYEQLQQSFAMSGIGKSFEKYDAFKHKAEDLGKTASDQLSDISSSIKDLPALFEKLIGAVTKLASVGGGQ